MIELPSEIKILQPNDALYNPQFYFRIVSKSFEIIQSLLPRINSIYQTLQEQETIISSFEKRIIKLQNQNLNFIYEIRTTNLSVDEKLKFMESNYFNIVNELNAIKESTFSKDKEFQRYQRRCETFIYRPNQKSLASSLQNQQKDKDQQIDENLSIYLAKSSPKVNFSEKNVNIEIISSQNFIENENIKESEPKIDIKSTKLLKKLSGTKHVRYEEIPCDLPSNNSIQERKNQQTQNLQKLQNYFLIQKQIYEALNSDIQELKSQIKSKINDTQFNQFKDKVSHWQAQTVKSIQTKINKDECKEQFTTIHKLMASISQEHKHFANRQETIKALQFLDKRIVSNHNEINKIKLKDNEQKCLKIEKIEHPKRIDRSTFCFSGALSSEDAKENADMQKEKSAYYKKQLKQKRPVSSFKERQINQTEPRFNEGYSCSRLSYHPPQFKQVKSSKEQMIRNLKKKTCEALNLSNSSKIKKQIKCNMVEYL